MEQGMSQYREIASWLTRTRIRDACWMNKKKKVSRFERSRRNENTRAGTIIARRFCQARSRRDREHDRKSPTDHPANFTPAEHCTKNTTHVPRVPFKNQFRKIILIGLPPREEERGSDKNRAWLVKELEWWATETLHYTIEYMYIFVEYIFK